MNLSKKSLNKTETKNKNPKNHGMNRGLPPPAPAEVKAIAGTGEAIIARDWVGVRLLGSGSPNRGSISGEKSRNLPRKRSLGQNRENLRRKTKADLFCLEEFCTPVTPTLLKRKTNLLPPVVSESFRYRGTHGEVPKHGPRAKSAA